MISLSDRQLAIVMEAARPLPPEKRGIFLPVSERAAGVGRDVAKASSRLASKRA